jgi:hypothetical protein
MRLLSRNLDHVGFVVAKLRLTAVQHLARARSNVSRPQPGSRCHHQNSTPVRKVGWRTGANDRQDNSQDQPVVTFVGWCRGEAQVRASSRTKDTQIKFLDGERRTDIGSVLRTERLLTGVNPEVHAGRSGRPS